MNLAELFDGGSVQWAMHTTMVLNYGYAAQLLALPYMPNGTLSQNTIATALTEAKASTAFFYNQATPLKASGCSPKLPLQNLNLFPVNCGKTLHAKVSLVCLKDGEELFYRLGVFSKNTTFAKNCLEVGGVFRIAFPQQPTVDETANGTQLCAFLTTLYGGCKNNADDINGQTWLQEHGLYHNENQNNSETENLFARFEKGIRIELETAASLGSAASAAAEDVAEPRAARLFFGGCGQARLYNALDLCSCDREDSVIITPPAFVESNQNNTILFFQNKIALYDLISAAGRNDAELTVSHAKLYLLKKGDTYELFLGSANCTPHGIGWNFDCQSSEDSGQESVECLVRFSLSKEVFDKLRASIIACYQPYDFVNGKPLLSAHKPDPWGELLADGTVKGVCYKTSNGNWTSEQPPASLHKIVYTIELHKDIPNDMPESFPIRPMEYKDEQEIIANELHGKNITLTYEMNGQNFTPTQRALLVGKSGCVLPIHVDLMEGVPQPKGAVTRFGTALSDAWAAESAEEAADGLAKLASLAKRTQTQLDLVALSELFAALKEG